MQEALHYIRNDPDASFRGAEARFGVAPSTLGDRHRGALSRAEAAELRQVMDTKLEIHLAEWIKHQNQICLSPTTAQTKEMAELLLKLVETPKELGKSWYNGFRNRHPEIVCKRKRTIDAPRRDCCSVEALQSHIERVATRIATRRIKPQNIWNMDETGVSIGLDGSQYVLIDLQELRRRSFFRTQVGTRENVSVIECVNAVGEYTPLFAIYKSLSREVQTDWFPIGYKEQLELEGCVFHTSESGWTSNWMAIEWLRRVYLQYTKPTNDQEWRLLIVDGHGSHATADFMYECFTNKVELLYLPAHTSHISQPLDVGVFGPLKTYYRGIIASHTINTAQTAYFKRRFIAAYVAARRKAFRRSNIEAGFRKSGIWPLEASVLTAMATLPPSETSTGISPAISTQIVTSKDSYLGRLTPRTRRRFTLEQRRRDSDAEKEIRSLRMRLEAVEREYPLLKGPPKQSTKRKRDLNEEFASTKKNSCQMVFAKMAEKMDEVDALKHTLEELEKEDVIQ
jgi:hypothetical protein